MKRRHLGSVLNFYEKFTREEEEERERDTERESHILRVEKEERVRYIESDRGRDYEGSEERFVLRDSVSRCGDVLERNMGVDGCICIQMIESI